MAIRVPWRAVVQSGVALGVVAFASFQLAVHVAREPDVGLAESIVQGVDEAPVAAFANLTVRATTPANTACRTTPLKSEVTISLFLADQSISDERAGRLEDIGRLDRQLERGERAIRNLLSCSPTDGNAWLRSGLLSAYAAGFGGDAARLIERSQTYAPHERRVLEARLSRIPPQSQSAGSPSDLMKVRSKDQAVLDRVK